MGVGFFKDLMKTWVRPFFGSFRLKVMATLILAMVLMALASNLVVQQFVLHAQFEQLRRKLTLVASAIAISLDAGQVQAIPLNRDGVYTPEYQSILRKLQEIKDENPSIGFIYIMARTDEKNILQFVVDPDPYLVRKGRMTAYPGDKYDTASFPDMVKAFDHALADKVIGEDEWGKILSGYAPIRDQEGNAVAILGVDMLASDIYQTQRTVHRRLLLVLLSGVLLSILLGVWFSMNLTRPVRALSEGIRRVSHGDLSYKVRIHGHDEISGLCRSFNKMAEDLRVTRKKNQEYFYDVMQSLVRIVEARDPYTRGHSERVAEYASQIAVRMGFPNEAVEMLRQAAVLHDIGKLGVHEDILTKPGKLTAEEWEILRSHPVIGEDILKPVLLSAEMLSVVRSHHERYDGTGYPDQLTGDEINVFAQILSVADAYDAMTSTRPYRVALNQEEAVKELEKYRNAQFNPKIADTFIQILRERKA